MRTRGLDSEYDGGEGKACGGVVLHGRYWRGAAQRVYTKRGYVPDGSGVWYRDEVCPPYGTCCNDDD